MMHQTVYRLSPEAYDKLFTAPYLNILPDDLFDALRYGKQEETHPHTDVYANPKSKTVLYVNRADGLIVDLGKSGSEREDVPCLPCQHRGKGYGLITKYGEILDFKGSGDSGDGDNNNDIPDCLPNDPYSPPIEGWKWRGRGKTPETRKGNFYDPETGAWAYPDFWGTRHEGQGKSTYLQIKEGKTHD